MTRACPLVSCCTRNAHQFHLSPALDNEQGAPVMFRQWNRRRWSRGGGGALGCDDIESASLLGLFAGFNKTSSFMLLTWFGSHEGLDFNTEGKAALHHLSCTVNTRVDMHGVRGWFLKGDIIEWTAVQFSAPLRPDLDFVETSTNTNHLEMIWFYRFTVIYRFCSIAPGSRSTITFLLWLFCSAYISEFVVCFF